MVCSAWLAILALAVFASSLVLAVALHVGTPPARRLVARELPSLLASAFPGKLVVHSVGSLSLTGASRVDIDLIHPDGAQVAALRGVQAEIDTLGALRSLTGAGPLVVELGIEIGSIDVDVSSKDGRLRIVEVFVDEEAPTPPEAAEGAGLDLRVQRLAVSHVWAHGRVGDDGPWIDVDLDELAAAVLVTPDATLVAVERAELTTRAAPRGADLRVRLSGAFETRAAEPSGQASASAFFALDGTVATTPVASLGLLQGDSVHAVVLLPHVEPHQIGRIAPEAPPVTAPVRLAALVDGTFQRLGAWVSLGAGASRLVVDADVILEPSLAAIAHARGVALDAALVGGPPSSLSVTLDASVRAPADGPPRGELSLLSEAGSAQDVAIPPIAMSATFHGDSARGRAEIREPGAITEVHFEVAGPPEGARIDVSVVAPRIELERLRSRGVEAAGVGFLEAHARVDLASETVHGNLHVEGTGLALPSAGVKIAGLALDVRAAGPLRDPDVKADLVARQIHVADRHVHWVTASARGPALQPLVHLELSSEDLPRIVARSRVEVARSALHDTSIEARRGTTTARLRVDRVELGAGTPALRGLTVDGLGERLTASILPRPGGGLRVVASAPRLSISSIQQLSGLDLGLSEGEVVLDADVIVDPQALEGAVKLQVRDLSFRQEDGVHVEHLSSELEATFAGRRVELALAAETKAIGRVALSTPRPLDLAGPPDDPRSWQNAKGCLVLDADVDLAAVARLVPRRLLPVDDATGRLALAARVDREVEGGVPSFEVSLRTRGLTLVGKPIPGPPRETGPDPTPTPGWNVRGIDLQVAASGDADPARVTVRAAARDAAGDLITVDLGADLPYERLLAIRGGGDWRFLEDVPLHLQVAVPSRPIRDLPPVLGIPTMEGRVVADLEVLGTLRRPKLVLDGGLLQLSLPKSALEEPFSAKVLAEYDGAKLTAHVAIDQSTRRLLKATGEARVASSDLLRSEEGRPLPWTASADVKLGPLPLDILQAVLPSRVEGVATGEIHLAKLHEDAALVADVRVDGLVLGGIPHREASVKVTAREGRLDGAVRFVQPNGSLEADLELGIDWGARLVPELRAEDRFDVAVRARSFRLRAVEPFLTSTFHQLDGRLDGSVRVSQLALREAKQGRGLQGDLKLSRGRMELVAAGGPLEDVEATARLDERGVLRIQGIRARGLTGEVRAEAVATFGKRGFEQAKLNVGIPERQPMPILVEGEHLGDVSGALEIVAGWADDGRELRVVVDVPRLAVALPDRLPDGVQKLDDMERARIGTVRDGRFHPVALDAPDPRPAEATGGFRTRVDIVLRDASISKGDMLRTRLTGNPSLVMEGDATRMAGVIHVKGGRIDIKGRLFEIESGTITFGKDPANPDVLLTASWKAPDDTVVFADFAGPLKTGKVTLRSNPPRSREEIIALVIFGRVEGYQAGGEQADTATQAVGAAGGFATQGLNKVLDDVTPLDIRTRVDTSSSTNPKPELEVQISQEVAVKISYLLGEIAPGQSADKTFATIDWHFRPEWSLETTVGDRASTTVDMIWERLY